MSSSTKKMGQSQPSSPSSLAEKNSPKSASDVPGPSTSAPVQETEEIDEHEAFQIILNSLKQLEKNRDERRKLFQIKRLTLEQVSRDGEREKPLPPGSIFGLHKLEDTDHLFVQYTNDRSPFIHEMDRRFEILNSNGERVLFAVEQTGSMINAFSYLSLHDFDFSFIDPSCGKEAFSISSRARLFGIRGTEIRLFKDKTQIGKILQTGHYGSTVYKIMDSNSKLRFLIKPSEDYEERVRPSFFQRLNAAEDIDVEFPEEFNILAADESIFVGRIMGTWSKKETISEERYASTEEDTSSSSSDDDSDEARSQGTLTTGKTVSVGSGTEQRKRSKSSVSIPKSLQSNDTSTPAKARSLPTSKSPSIQRRLSGEARCTYKFNRERCKKFLETINKNIETWEWYFDGEYFGAEFTAQLGPISRAAIVAVILTQYLRIHFDRHHRRKSSRMLFRKSFKQWCIFTGICGILVLLIILLDYNTI